MLYDKIALALAVYPMLLFYLTFFTAPMAIFVAIRYWKAPASILPRTRIRSVIAIVRYFRLRAGSRCLRS